MGPVFIVPVSVVILRGSAELSGSGTAWGAVPEVSSADVFDAAVVEAGLGFWTGLPGKVSRKKGWAFSMSPLSDGIWRGASVLARRWGMKGTVCTEKGIVPWKLMRTR